MFTSSYQGFQTQPIGLANSGVSPQSFDLGAVANSVAQSAAQTLPGLLMSLLSAHPQIQQLARQGGITYGGVNPQAQTQFGSAINNPFGTAGWAQQGVDLDSVVNSVAQSTAQALPGLLMSLLSAHPQIQQLARQGGVNYGGINQQTLQPQQNPFGAGFNNPFGGGQSLFNNTRQQGGQQTWQQAGQQAGGQQYASAAPQGFDLGAIVNTVAQSAAQALPGLLASLLSANPQIQQIARQAGGAYTPNQYGFGGGGLNIFDSRPQQFSGQQYAGAGQQYAGAAPQQAVDLGSIAQNLAGIISPQIPSIVGNVMGQMLGSQQTVH